MRNVKFILQLLLGFALILIAVYSPLNEDGRVAVGNSNVPYNHSGLVTKMRP